MIKEYKASSNEALTPANRFDSNEQLYKPVIPINYLEVEDDALKQGPISKLIDDESAYKEHVPNISWQEGEIPIEETTLGSIILEKGDQFKKFRLLVGSPITYQGHLRQTVQIFEEEPEEEKSLSFKGKLTGVIRQNMFPNVESALDYLAEAEYEVPSIAVIIQEFITTNVSDSKEEQSTLLDESDLSILQGMLGLKTEEQVIQMNRNYSRERYIPTKYEDVWLYYPNERLDDEDNWDIHSPHDRPVLIKFGSQALQEFQQDLGLID